MRHPTGMRVYQTLKRSPRGSSGGSGGGDASTSHTGRETSWGAASLTTSATAPMSDRRIDWTRVGMTPSGPDVVEYSPPHVPKKPAVGPACMNPVYPISIEQPTMRHVGTTIATSAIMTATAIRVLRLCRKRFTSPLVLVQVPTIEQLPCLSPAISYSFCRNSSETELMQYLVPVGGGPSGNTCPR